MQTDHIAVLVRNVAAVSRTLPESCTRHELEEQPAEGTLEQYITAGDENVPSLLLIQAIADGPYQRALDKRGPGLHHIGCVCSNIEDEMAAVESARLLLHPVSLESRRHGTVWLCRPGMPYLIELSQHPKQASARLEQALVLLPAALGTPEHAAAISSNLSVRSAPASSVVIGLGGTEISIDPSLG